MDKIKRFLEGDRGKDILIFIIVILVGYGSFQLGRLSKNAENTASGVKIEYPGLNQGANVIGAEELAQTQFSGNSSAKAFFASNRGSKYYSLGCAGGKTIKQENRVYFATKEEAEGAGYELSTSCR